MKKKIFSTIAIIALICGTYTVALAGESNPLNATRNSLKSYGSIIYSDGTDNAVEIHANDLYTLADQLDKFKSCIVDQLAVMNTFFTSGNSGTSLIVHTPPISDDTVDPLSLNFDTIIDELAASQNIPTTVTEYGYSAGTSLFKTPTGLLTTTGSNSGMEQISISAASAENLSAGAAAWVEGNLILGSGDDDQAYYNQGYTDGYNKVMDNADISYTYHKHVTGNGTESSTTIYSTSSPGGCYVAAGHTHNATGSCPRYHNHALDHVEYRPGCAMKWVYDETGKEYFVPSCENKFEGYVGTLANGDKCHYHKVTTCDGSLNDYSCARATNTWVPNCGKTETTIESITIIFK